MSKFNFKWTIHDWDGDHRKKPDFIKDSRTNSILENIYFIALTPDFEIKVNVFENQIFFYIYIYI